MLDARRMANLVEQFHGSVSVAAFLRQKARYTAAAASARKARIVGLIAKCTPVPIATSSGFWFSVDAFGEAVTFKQIPVQSTFGLDRTAREKPCCGNRVGP